MIFPIQSSRIWIPSCQLPWSSEVTKSNFNPACLPDAIRIRWASKLG